jgi:hypothetical protein
MVPAALVAAAPAFATDYLTVEQAQTLLFPGATFTPADVILSETQIDELLKIARAPVFRSKVRAWRVSTGGWFILDQVVGRDDRITYALGLDKDGAVTGLEILVCLQEYSGIRSPRWRSQFVGRRYGTPEYAAEIASISGTTLSVDHIAEGVKRTLATFALYIAPKAG